MRKVHSGQTIAAPAQTDIAGPAEAVAAPAAALATPAEAVAAPAVVLAVPAEGAAGSVEIELTGVQRGLLPRLRIVEDHAVDLLQAVSLPLLRLALGTVFIWFGALKLSNNTPVADFVANTLPWFNRAWLVPALGIFEVAIGFAMIAGRYLTLVCAALVAHLTGTFLSLIMQPDVTFQHGNPLMLTTEGEFVVKNLVFIAAGLVLAARFNRRERTEK